MKIQDYLDVVLKRWWVIALVTIAAAVAAYGISKTQTPIFRSQTIYVVNVNRADSGAFMFADRLLASFVQAVYQPDKLQGVSDQLGLDQTGDWLMEYVRVQPQPEQMVIVIEADYFEPTTAQRIAAAVGDTLNAIVVENNRTLQGEDRINLRQAQSAKGAWLAKPQTKINVLAASLLGIVAGVLLSFVLDYRDDTLKTSGDVERFAGLTTIGAIPTTGSPEGRRRLALRPSMASGLLAGTSGAGGDKPDRRS